MGSLAEPVLIREDIRGSAKNGIYVGNDDVARLQEAYKDDIKKELLANGYTDGESENDWRRVEAVEIEHIPGALPLANISADVDSAAVVASFFERLNSFKPGLFTDNALWRDVFSLTGTVRTFFGPQNIGTAWEDVAKIHQPQNFSFVPGSSKVKHVGEETAWIHAKFTFETKGHPAAKCSGIIGLVPDEKSGWKIWLLTTILEELEGFPNPDLLTDETSVTSNHEAGPIESHDWECIIVGGGYGGLCVAGRLKALGIRYLVIEKNDEIGDNWLQRYESARYHTSKWYSDMPIQRVFDDNYDYFLSSKELAKGFQAYVEKLNINVSLQTALEKATFDTKTQSWSMHISRASRKDVLSTKHFVLAIGAGSGQIPSMPELPRRDKFTGEVLHSAYYKNAFKWKGKKGVIVGAANTAHDVAEDMLEAGLTSVTMIQRGKTPVFPIEYYSKWSDPIYNENSSLEDTDREVMATPLAITRFTTMWGMKMLAAGQPERFEAMEKAGFKLDRELDLWKCLSKRNGGHYMDVGASKKIADGLIKMKSDAALVSYDENGVNFSDGAHLDADVVVFCTGFSNEYRNEAIKFVGEEIGEKLDDYWQLDSEGELRGAYKPQGCPGIWYTGGGVTYARFYSRYIGLQIKADLAGTPLKLYRKYPNRKKI